MERSKWIGYGVKAVSAVLGVAGGMIISEKLGNKKHEEVEQPTAEVIVPATEVVTVEPETTETKETTETSETNEN